MLTCPAIHGPLVTTEDSMVLGLLCLKTSVLGFCSDADVVCRSLSMQASFTAFIP
jgi:hypothetical protein